MPYHCIITLGSVSPAAFGWTLLGAIVLFAPPAKCMGEMSHQPARSVMSRADEGSHIAKSRGRNAVVVVPAPPNDPEPAAS